MNRVIARIDLIAHFEAAAQVARRPEIHAAAEIDQVEMAVAKEVRIPGSDERVDAAVVALVEVVVAVGREEPEGVIAPGSERTDGAPVDTPAPGLGPRQFDARA